MVEESRKPAQRAFHRIARGCRPLVAGALAIAAFGAFAPPLARAHFILEEPASWSSQDALGSPQKLGPCGDEPGGTPTGEVTTFQQGRTITVTIRETIFHPGHYRIALAVGDRSELPPEPIVTAAATPCGSAAIQDPPVFPVLADGVLAHTAPFSGPQSVQVTLPPDVTCTHCTLQVIEFMSDHGLNNPGGCFYHHCADVAITATSQDGGSGDDASAEDASSESDAAPATDTSGDAAAAGASPASEGGCNASGAPGAGGGAWALLLGLAALARRRRAGERT